MPLPRIDEALVERLHRRAGAERWGVTLGGFAEALDASVTRAFAHTTPGRGGIARYLEGLHLEDLALATGCASGHEGAWEHFVREYRPVLYRAAEAIDRSGGARDLADSLHAELFGLEERGGARRSLFQYFHGRSSLATWLRAVLAQRHVDRLRAGRRDEPLADEDSSAALAGPSPPPNPDRSRYLALIRPVLNRALAALAPRDRLALACYYAQELTLAEIGRLTGEHEATVSRRLAKTRRALRAEVELRLRADAGLTEAEIAECFASVVEDPGSLDLGEMLAAGDRGKNSN
jgi:RNA polymerase sigma-70 factor (ECF subfamily)